MLDDERAIDYFQELRIKSSKICNVKLKFHTITLKVDSYSVNKKRISIECSTADTKQIRISGNSRRHDEETKPMKNDLVKFVDIVFIKSENGTILLKFDENTTVFSLSRNGKILDIPKEILTKKKDFICPICFEECWIKNGQVFCTPFEPRNNGKVATHRICENCIKQLAKSALTDAPLAFNGIGLPCCVPKCGNVFLMSEFENYLDEKVRRVLMSRMQRESILAANMDDLVICPDCSAMNIVDPCEIYYDCVCGRRRCRNCPRIYDEIHAKYTCKEMYSRGKIESKLSKVVVRQCPRCHLQFVKSAGCNKMICRCGKMQCYLCRASITDSRSHFCSCGDDINDGPCKWCNKICVLHCDADEYDKRQLEKIKKENGYKDYGPTSKSLFLKIFGAFFVVFVFIVLFSKFVGTRRVPC
uniref:RING-type domain-containing protein n=1 Tax=Panagrolaimus sp. JU765 TaxID=591449 RepID=A0AC34Q098_9BILA